jgi:LDH2 family malate/lactate/ureidoglycolate dehydrogenase
MGVPEDDAEMVTDALIKANLRGVTPVNKIETEQLF